jgi:protein involved in temperature-dependent protein secretion
VRIGRTTEWEEQDGLGFRGVGQHILFSAHGEAERQTPLLEVRRIEIDAAPDTRG